MFILGIIRIILTLILMIPILILAIIDGIMVIGGAEQDYISLKLLNWSFNFGEQN